MLYLITCIFAFQCFAAYQMICLSKELDDTLTELEIVRERLTKITHHIRPENMIDIGK